jgi:hypothetical protein
MDHRDYGPRMRWRLRYFPAVGEKYRPGEQNNHWRLRDVREESVSGCQFLYPRELSDGRPSRNLCTRTWTRKYSISLLFRPPRLVQRQSTISLLESDGRLITGSDWHGSYIPRRERLVGPHDRPCYPWMLTIAASGPACQRLGRKSSTITND